MKNRNTILMMLAACLTGLVGIASADQIFLEASDDSWVNGNSQDANNGGATAGVIRYQSATWGQNLSLFKFDISTLPANIEVTSVRMRFYTSLSSWPVGGTNFAPVAVFNNTQDWDETNVTFANAPTYNATAIETLDHLGASWNPVYFTGTNTIDSAGWMEFQGAGTVVLVQGWADGTIDNFGITMWGAGDFLPDQRSFRPQTKEHSNSALHPEIIVNYTIIPEPATMGLIGFVAAGLLVVRRFLTV